MKNFEVSFLNKTKTVNKDCHIYHGRETNSLTDFYHGKIFDIN